MRETPDELRAPVAYLRRFLPCPHWTTVEAHPGLCATCGVDNGESCPIREACDRIDALLARLATAEAERDLAEAVCDVAIKAQSRYARWQREGRAEDAEVVADFDRRFNTWAEARRTRRLLDEAVARREQP